MSYLSLYLSNNNAHTHTHTHTHTLMHTEYALFYLHRHTYVNKDYTWIFIPILMSACCIRQEHSVPSSWGSHVWICMFYMPILCSQKRPSVSSFIFANWTSSYTHTHTNTHRQTDRGICSYRTHTHTASNQSVNPRGGIADVSPMVFFVLGDISAAVMDM